MLSKKLVVVGLVGVISLVATMATAEDAAAPGSQVIAAGDISFVDPTDPFDSTDSDTIELRFGAGEQQRFSAFAPSGGARRDHDNYDRYEVAVVASTPGDFGVSFAQRGGVGYNNQGDIERESSGSELRLGRGLRRNDRLGAPAWYVFAASDDEALVWRPGARTEFGGAGSSFSLQDRVEIGDMQAGVTYESNGWQASFAYVERKVSARTGSRTVSQDESFTGVTFTMRH